MARTRTEPGGGRGGVRTAVLAVAVVLAVASTAVVVLTRIGAKAYAMICTTMRNHAVDG